MVDNRGSRRHSRLNVEWWLSVACDAFQLRNDCVPSVINYDVNRVYFVNDSSESRSRLTLVVSHEQATVCIALAPMTMVLGSERLC